MFDFPKEFVFYRQVLLKLALPEMTLFYPNRASYVLPVNQNERNPPDQDRR